MLDRLAERVPVRMTVIAAQPPGLWPSHLRPVTSWVDASCDVGVEQSDDVTVDAAATRAALSDWLACVPDIVEREARRLRSGFDLVIGDVPPPAFEAAAAARVPSVALANFSWDWIYRELGFEDAAAICASMYGTAGLLLETAPAAPMDAFVRRHSLGLVTRRPSARRQHTRTSLGIGDHEQVVLLAVRPDSAALVSLPPQSPGIRYLLPSGWPAGRLREDVLDECALEFLELIAAADVVVGKPGYGLIGDAAASATRLLWVSRPGFPENAVLERWLRDHRCTREVSRDALRSGEWSQDLRLLIEEPAPAPFDLSPADRAAEALAECLRA